MEYSDYERRFSSQEQRLMRLQRLYRHVLGESLDEYLNLANLPRAREYVHHEDSAVRALALDVLGSFPELLPANDEMESTLESIIYGDPSLAVRSKAVCVLGLAALRRADGKRSKFFAMIASDTSEPLSLRSLAYEMCLTCWPHHSDILRLLRARRAQPPKVNNAEAITPQFDEAFLREAITPQFDEAFLRKVLETGEPEAEKA